MKAARARMQVIGILGGVASGKSLIAAVLADAGAGLLDADRAGHEVLRLPAVTRAAQNRWGDGVFDTAGQIDRTRLARIVFAPPPEGPKEREFLEKLTHPRIARRIEEQAHALEAAGYPAAVLDAPLLLEAGWDRLCNKLIFVDVPRDIRLARARRRGWSPAEFAAREDAQLPVDVKRARADLILENAGKLEDTRRRAMRLAGSLFAA